MSNYDLIRLVRDVFSAGPGALLMDALTKEMLYRSSYDDVANRLYWLGGQEEMIKQWKRMLCMSEEEIEEIKRNEEISKELAPSDDILDKHMSNIGE